MIPSSCDPALRDLQLAPSRSIAPEVLAAQEDLTRLGDRIAELSAQIQVAEYYLLVLIREFDERGGWGGGFRSCAHWLNWRTGLGLGAAREKMRVARALAELPLISEAMSRGQVSYSKVRALTRVATADTEGGLLGFAQAGSATHVERLVRSWRHVDRLDEAMSDGMRLRSRSLITFIDDDGMLVIQGRLDPATGAVVLRALDAARDSLYLANQLPTDEVGTDTPIEHRNADALGLVAESALNARLDPGTRADRYQVVVHVDAPVLRELGPDATGQTGMAMLDDAVGVSAETSRRLACDCAVVTMTHGSDGTILDVGRRKRTISPGMRRALTFRDRTCRFPACGVTVGDGHHIKHWADGGETKLENLLLLCRRHHTAVHEEGYGVERLPDGQARFFHPTGWEIKAAPAQPWIAGGSEVLAKYVAAAGVRVGGSTGSATSVENQIDYGWAVEVLRPAARWVDAVEHVPAGTSGWAAEEESLTAESAERTTESAALDPELAGLEMESAANATEFAPYVPELGWVAALTQSAEWTAAA